MVARIVVACGIAAFAAAWSSTASAQAKPEKQKVVIAMGGVSSQIYFLVPNLAMRQGYFKDEGLEIEAVDMGSGAKGLEALIGGNADITAGAYEHTIQMQAKGIPIKCFVQYGASGGTVLGVVKSKAKANPTPADLKGEIVGVSAPGSSTHVFLNLALGKANVKPDDVSVVAIGNGPGAIAAVRGGKVVGISGVDPVMTELEVNGDIVILADARTDAGGKAAYGGPFVSGCLYAKEEWLARNPNTAQAIANAMTRAVRYVKSTPVDRIIAALPPEYSKANPAVYRTALERNLPGIPESQAVDPEAARTVLRVVAFADPKFDASKIDLAKTYDNRFAEAAMKKPR